MNNNMTWKEHMYGEKLRAEHPEWKKELRGGSP